MLVHMIQKLQGMIQKLKNLSDFYIFRIYASGQDSYGEKLMDLASLHHVLSSSHISFHQNLIPPKCIRSILLPLAQITLGVGNNGCVKQISSYDISSSQVNLQCMLDQFVNVFNLKPFFIPMRSYYFHYIWLVEEHSKNLNNHSTLLSFTFH